MLVKIIFIKINSIYITYKDILTGTNLIVKLI
jgi:hypothetical protein